MTDLVAFANSGKCALDGAVCCAGKFIEKFRTSVNDIVFWQIRIIFLSLSLKYRRTGFMLPVSLNSEFINQQRICFEQLAINIHKFTSIMIIVVFDFGIN